MKTSLGMALLVSLDRASEDPLHVQLERQLRSGVQTGRLSAHTLLPSTRSLAADLNLSRGVVVEAYEQLIAEGYFQAEAGSGTRVAALRTEASRRATAEPARPAPRYDFQPGTPDVLSFPRRAWFASLRRAFASAPAEAFLYPNPRGPLATRAALAGYLGRSRATVGQADCIVMCNGFLQGVDLVARLLKARGVRHVAVEDPGFGKLAALFRALEIAVHPIPIDAHGLVVERLHATPAAAVFATPVHQFPTGAGMSAERRTALLAWAQARDALIVEDDYDAEYRYDREPLGALQGMAPDRVIYIGTGSKILSPALRLGWLLASPALAGELAALKLRADGGSSIVDHLALADFVNAGELDRHLRRMRQIYRRRRDLMVEALGEHLPELEVGGMRAGLHLMVNLPGHVDEAALVARAREQSIAVFAASDYRVRPAPDEPAMVLGYGCAVDSQIGRGIKRLAQLVREGAG